MGPDEGKAPTALRPGLSDDATRGRARSVPEANLQNSATHYIVSLTAG